MLHKKLTKAAQAGFTLMESMIALVIIGVIISALMVFLSQTSDNSLFTEALSTRMALNQSVERVINNYPALVWSATHGTSSGNTALRNCLLGSAAACVAGSEATATDFDLYANNAATPMTIGSGTSYTRSGAPDCIPDPTRPTYCPFFKVKTSFYALCPSDAKGKPLPACSQATTVYVVSKVTADPTNVAKLFGQRDLAEQKLVVSHHVITPGILKSGQDCNPGAEQIGFSSGGSIKCRCRYNYKQTGVDADGSPFCDAVDLKCPDSWLLFGRDSLGQPKCLETIKKCNWISFGKEDATCPNAGWMEKLDLGYCRPGNYAKKASSRAIKCDTNKGYCCWYEAK